MKNFPNFSVNCMSSIHRNNFWNQDHNTQLVCVMAPLKSLQVLGVFLTKEEILVCLRGREVHDLSGLLLPRIHCHCALLQNMTVTPPVIIKSNSVMRISSPRAQTPTHLPSQTTKVMTRMMTMFPRYKAPGAPAAPW